VLAVSAVQLPAIAWGSKPAETIIEWNQIAQVYAAGPPFALTRA
jgi:hypothetical protein